MRRYAAWVAVPLLLALLLGHATAAQAQTAVEAGPTFLSGEFSEGANFILTHKAEKFAYGFGIVSEQVCHCNWPADVDEQLFVEALRHFQGEKWELGIGPSYWQNTSRVFGRHFNASILVGRRIGGGLRWRIRHFSNGGSGKPNLGQDFYLNLSYSFR
jgi:hypothetical protein